MGETGHRTADELKSDHLQALGAELGPIYHELWNEVAWLHMQWRLFMELFGSQQNVDLLNRTAHRFFGMVHESLIDSIVLSIARLTGPVTSCGQPNLSIYRVRDLVNDPQLCKALSAALAKGEPTWEKLKPWRHKRLAHRDLDVALGKTALAGPMFATIKDALDHIAFALNTLEGDLLGGPVAYAEGRVLGGGVGALLHYLQRGEDRVEIPSP